MNKYFFLPIALLVAPLVHAASVNDVCGTTRAPLTRIYDLNAAQKSVKELRALYPDPGVSKKADEVLAVIKTLKAEPADEDDWEPKSPLDREELKTAMMGLGKALRLKTIPTIFKPTKIDDRSKALSRLFSEYGKMEQRFANPQGYFKRMMEVIATTSRGAQLINCFQGKESPRISSSVVEFTPRSESALVDSGSKAHFGLRRLSSGNYQKFLSFDPGPYPAFAITMVAHELQHACNTLEFIKLKDLEHKLDQETSFTPENLQARSLISVKFAIDEMRAYKFQPEFFKELAVYQPAMFCHVFYVGSFYGRQVMSSADYMNSVESHMNNKNRFFHNLFDAYSQRDYSASDYYEQDPNTLEIKKDAKGRRVMKAKVRQLFIDAGYPID